MTYSTDDLAAIVEAEEFAGGRMTPRQNALGPHAPYVEVVGPLPKPHSDHKPRPTVWVVKQASGGEVRVLAEWHTTYARPDGTELRFYNGTGDNQHRVATVRAGSWHWTVAATALEPKTGEPTC